MSKSKPFLTWKLWLIVISTLALSSGLTAGLANAEFEAPSMAIPGQCYMNIGAVICIAHPPASIIPYIIPNPLIKPTVNGTLLIPIPINALQSAK